MGKKFTIILCLFIAFVTTGKAQPVSYQQLEQQVFQLNNKLKYNESQKLLLPVIHSETYSDDERYQAAILLSYTYKRVFDYQSTVKFLKTARKFALQTPKKDQYVATIRSEEAFALFDVGDYKQAGHLMKQLEASDFQYISLENRSKLVMQQAYLLFLDKRYEQAEATYDKAIALMQVSAPCHLPMIYVKKMDLYSAMKRFDLLNDALKRSTIKADSCHILKYHLYAYEELLKIYKQQNNLLQIFLTQKKLDSLNILYAREKNIAALHNQQETLLLENKEQELHQEQILKTQITAGLLIVMLGLLIWLYTYRRKQHWMEAEFERMKAALGAYIIQSKTSAPAKITLVNDQLALSERQRDVLDCLAVGMSNKAIADTLFISENTVKYHIKNIYQLLEIKDRKELLVSLKK